MLILMNIIQGRNRSVPEIINLEMLARLAILVDYYDCHEVLGERIGSHSERVL